MIHIHLGRYGKFRVHDHPAPKPVGKVRLRMEGMHMTIDLNGPTACEVIESAQRLSVLDRLGPDPLGGGRKADALQLISDSKRPIGTLLLDQSIIAGVGNIFRAELLFQLQLDPETRGCEIPESTLDQLWRSLKKMMKTGVRYGRIITVTAKEAGQPLSKIQGGDRFRIYGKDGCPTCDEPIETIELAARKLYYCPVCQR